MIHPFAFFKNNDLWRGLVLRLKSTSVSGADNDPVSTWPDSASDNNATSSGSERPILKTGILNGLPVIEFDGADDFMAIGSSLKFRTVFVVGKSYETPFSDYRGILGGPNADYDIGGYLLNGEDSTSNLKKGTSLAEFSVMRRNGVDVLSNGDFDPIDEYWIGSFVYTTDREQTADIGRIAGGGRYWEGAFADIIVFNRPLNIGEIETIEAILIGEYDLYKKLFNDYPGASLGLSLRKLDSAYTGSCIRVRRDSDDAEMDMGFVNGWLDTATLLTFVGAGSGFVKVWYDQSGNGNDATQTTFGAQPRIVNAGVLETDNGKPSICFSDGVVFGYMLIPSMSLFETTEISFFCVWNVKPFASSNAGVFGPSDNNSTGLEILQHDVIDRPSLLRIDGTPRNNNGGASYQLWDDDTQSLTSFYGDAVSVSAYKNLVPVTLTNDDAMPALNYNGVYGIGIYNSPSELMLGKIQEVIIYEDQKEGEGIEENIIEAFAVVNLLHRWRASDLSGADNDPVSLWSDSKGDNDATAVSDEPTLKTNIINGLPVVELDGSNDALYLTTDVTTARTIIIVFKEDPAASENLSPVLGSDTTFDFHRGLTKFIFDEGNTNPAILEGQVYLNGELIDPLTTAVPTEFSILTIISTGNMSFNNISFDRISGRYFKGQYADISVYSTSLTTSQRLEAEALLRTEYALSTLHDDIWAYYKLDTDADDSVGSNDGVVTDATLTTGGGGKIGEGYYGDGDEGVIDFPGLTGYDWTSEDFSFAIWAESEGNNGTGIRGLVSNRGGDSTGWITLGILTSSLTIEVAGGIAYNTPGYAPDGQGWVRYLVTKSGTTVRVYINGSLYATYTITENMGGVSEMLRIGEWFVTGQNWNGTLDEFVVWQRELTAAEALQDYNDGDGIQYPY